MHEHEHYYLPEYVTGQATYLSPLPPFDTFQVVNRNGMENNFIFAERIYLSVCKF